jgi:hypothetical protein
MEGIKGRNQRKTKIKVRNEGRNQTEESKEGIKGSHQRKPSKEAIKGRGMEKKGTKRREEGRK